jgi:hypothetical protein
MVRGQVAEEPLDSHAFVHNRFPCHPRSRRARRRVHTVVHQRLIEDVGALVQRERTRVEIVFPVLRCTERFDKTAGRAEGVPTDQQARRSEVPVRVPQVAETQVRGPVDAGR